MNTEPKTIEHFVPSLQHAVRESALDPAKLFVSLARSPEGSASKSRHQILLSDQDRSGEWAVPSLRELFRGDKVPPSLEQFPVEYVAHFAFIEKHVSAFFVAFAPQTDQQMEDIYANLARRPDGRSLGLAHDFIWQAAALLLGTRELSEAQFEAIFRRLARSARTFSIRPASRNYAQSLQSMFG